MFQSNKVTSCVSLWLFLFPLTRMSASWRTTTLTSSWQTATSTWPTATSQSAPTPQGPTPAAAQPSLAPQPLTTWTESWRTGIMSWWWGARAWCYPWTTPSRPLRTPAATCRCEDTSAQTQTTVRLRLTRAVEQAPSTWQNPLLPFSSLSRAYCLIPLAFSPVHSNIFSLPLTANHSLYLILLLLLSAPFWHPPCLSCSLIYLQVFFLFVCGLKVSSSFARQSPYCSIAQRSSSMCLCVNASTDHKLICRCTV